MSKEKEKVKTGLMLPLKLWREVKVYAAKEGLKLTQVVEAALKRYIELTEEEAKAKAEKV